MRMDRSSLTPVRDALPARCQGIDEGAMTSAARIKHHFGKVKPHSQPPEPKISWHVLAVCRGEMYRSRAPKQSSAPR